MTFSLVLPLWFCGGGGGSGGSGGGDDGNEDGDCYIVVSSTLGAFWLGNITLYCVISNKCPPSNKPPS